LLKSHHEYVQSTDSRLKSFQQRLTSFQGLESQVSGLKKQVTDLNDKVTASDAAFVKAKAKGKERKKKIKSLSKSLDQFTGWFSEPGSKFFTINKFSRVQGELLSLAASAGFERGLHMDRTQEQLDAAIKKISHFVHGAQAFLEQNEEWVRAMVDTPDTEMMDGVAGEPTKVIVQGIVHRVCDDVTQVESSLTQDSGLVPPAPSDIIVS
ncbi:hypothetical protein Tco_0242802, partial [Tanacetum coccineum]